MQKAIHNFLIISLGNLIYTVAVAFFILPNNLITGGTTGLALFGQYMFHIPITAFVYVFNIAMFLLGAWVLGKAFALTTILSTFEYPFFLSILQLLSSRVGPLTDDMMLATLFAGAGIGIGLGLVIQAGASTGGMDIPPLILNKLFKIPVSISMYVFDTLIVLAQFGFSDVRQCLYGIVLIFIYTMVIDKILVMGAQKIEVKIISSKYEEIRKAILTNVDRGVTMLHGQTGYLLENTEVLINVISTRELVQVERLVKSIDEDAFMIISNVHEVQGRGFNLEKEYIEK